jgi:hypothetical protein
MAVGSITVLNVLPLSSVKTQVPFVSCPCEVKGFIAPKLIRDEQSITLDVQLLVESRS